jgi:tripartite-type tricarboxylate transporter receptor subunit TctC
MKVAHLGAGAVAAMLALSTPAPAQEHYPSRLITVVVPITAGTTIDILARLYGEALSRRFGQQVIISNRPGAGGLIGAQAVASAAPDGYTVPLANSGHADTRNHASKHRPSRLRHAYPQGHGAAHPAIGDDRAIELTRKL